LPRLVTAGVTVSINPDDPPMFGTTLTDEYAVAAELLDLDAVGVADLAIAAVDASFMSASDKARVRVEIDNHLAGRD
jgi:aminodeoxyfutalosine deaminase